MTNGRAVAGGVIANLIESVTESWLAALGDLAQTFGITGFVSNQVKASQGPDLTALAEAVDGDDGGVIASSQEKADAGHRIEESGLGVRDMSFDLRQQGSEAITKRNIGLIIIVEALGIDSGQGRGRQGGLAEHGENSVDGFGTSATGLATEKGLQSIGTQSQNLIRIGSVQK